MKRGSSSELKPNNHLVHSIKRHGLHIILIILAIVFLELLGKSFLLISIYSFAIILGALMLAWAAESAEMVMSEGLALAIVAWLQVLPEFTIEATIAWAGDITNLLANFTGANRILVGVGWPLVFFTTIFFHWKKTGRFYGELKLKREHSIEVIFLFLATAYFFVVYFKKSITIIDAIILGSVYILYLFVVSKLPHSSRKKIKRLYNGIPKDIISRKPSKARLLIFLLFVFGGIMMFISAGPFYRGMLLLAATLGLSPFLFVQWVAPFLSEFPEKTSAFYWASKIKTAPAAMMNLISSKITQWTALLALLPIVLSISMKSISSIPVVGLLSTELMLTIATSLYASIFLMKMRINFIEASLLFILWAAQFIFVELRSILIGVYFGLAIFEVFVYKNEMLKAMHSFRYITKKFLLTHR